MKKMIIPMLALVAGIAFSAFTEKGLFKNRSLETFVYTGTTAQDQDDASLYVPLSEDPGISCSGMQQIICHVDAEPDASGEHPNFSSGDPVSNPENFENITKRQLP